MLKVKQKNVPAAESMILQWRQKLDPLLDSQAAPTEQSHFFIHSLSGCMPSNVEMHHFIKGATLGREGGKVTGQSV